jgi:hypothetical protein
MHGGAIGPRWLEFFPFQNHKERTDWLSRLNIDFSATKNG